MSFHKFKTWFKKLGAGELDGADGDGSGEEQQQQQQHHHHQHGAGAAVVPVPQAPPAPGPAHAAGPQPQRSGTAVGQGPSVERGQQQLQQQQQQQRQPQPQPRQSAAGLSSQAEAAAGGARQQTEGQVVSAQHHPPQQQSNQNHQQPASQKPQAAAAAAAAPAPSQPPAANGKQMLDTREFFSEYGEANRYTILEVIGKGSYGIVCSALDNYTGEKVAIKKITNVFEHVSDATRILREIKLLRLLKHPDIVEIKHIMLPPTPKEFKDIYVVFELLETDLHQVIKANDDLTPEHHQFFLYQMLRGLKYIHSAKVFHRDLKPKNILANSDCKLKICDFGLARPAFNDMPTTVFWTDYVATRWYRAPELCGSFFAKYSPSIDTWSVGCIFAEVLLGKPLFPGRNVVHQLELITDLLGTPSAEVIAKVRNEKARRFLTNMRYKPGVPFTEHFPKADPAALKLLWKLLAFDPADRPTSEEALADPYFTGLHSVAREPVAQPISKLAFEFDRRKLTIEDVRELIYREVLEYHPQSLHDHLAGLNRSTFAYPSALDSFKRQFMILEAGGAKNQNRIMQATSLPKEWVADFQHEASKYAPKANGQQIVEEVQEEVHNNHNQTGVVPMETCATAAQVAYAAAMVPTPPPAAAGHALYRSESHNTRLL